MVSGLEAYWLITPFFTRNQTRVDDMESGCQNSIVVYERRGVAGRGVAFLVAQQMYKYVVGQVRSCLKNGASCQIVTKLIQKTRTLPDKTNLPHNCGKGLGVLYWGFFSTSSEGWLYSCPQMSSFIHLQRRHAPHRRERPLLAKEGTITKEFS